MNKHQRQRLFAGIYNGNCWCGQESRSGSGSDLRETGEIIEKLPIMLRKLGIQSILDVPCGDWNWMKHVDMTGIGYIGADIVPKIIEDNLRDHPGVDFRAIDVVCDPIPSVDAVLCRDLFGHLCESEVIKAVQNIRTSGAKYLIATTFPFVMSKIDSPTGGWRPINMNHYELCPVELIDEKLISAADGKNCGKYLAAFRLG